MQKRITGFVALQDFESFKESFANPLVYIPILLLGGLGSIKTAKSEKNIFIGTIAGITTGVILATAGYGQGYIGR